MSAEFGQRLSRIIKEQQATQQEQRQMSEACRQLRGDAESLLRERGRKHVYIANRVFDFAMLPLAVLVRAGELTPLTRAHRRFLETSEASYFGCVLQETDTSVGAMVFANDGDPARARQIQIGMWNGDEVMLLNGSRGVIAYIEDSPHFAVIEPSINFHGTRFDGRKYKEHHSATVADAEKYRELMAILRQPPPNARYVTSLPRLRF